MLAAPSTIDPATAWRLRWYPVVLLAAIGVAFVVAVSSGGGSSTVSGRIGADYPAFYGAGVLVADGRLDELYDQDAQADVQEQLFGDEDGYLGFAYAPHVAAAYAPLAELAYRTSYVVHTLLMVVALVAALHLLRPVMRIVDDWFPLAVLVSIGFYPMFMAVFGGQNTAITFLLLAVVWRSLAEDREVVAGIAVALLMFRPQYAIPVLGLLLLGRHFRAVVAASLGTAAIWMANAAMLGWTWTTHWLDSVAPFLDATAEANAPNAVSLLGFSRAVFGVDSPIATVIGGGASLVVVAVLAHAWWNRRLDLDARMALTATGIVLLSPHALFYDAGLMALTILLLVDRRRLGLGAAAVVWATGFLHAGRFVFDADPFAPVVAVVFVVAWLRLARPRTEPSTHETPRTETASVS